MAVISGTGIGDLLRGTNLTDTIFGFGGDDTLFGNGGDDTIDGGAGHDTMFGGSGNDTYIEDSRFDVISEAAGGGRDTILASSNVYLAASSAEIEVVQVTATAGRQVIGNATVDQTLIGNSGNDDLRSGGVDATLIGGGGNDLYFIDGDDTVIESANAGVDTVFFSAGAASASFTLGANLENLSANNLNVGVTLTGNSLNNTITGLNGNDTLAGLNGIDVLNGGAGNDVLDGGSNLDTLFGGTGDDTFIIADTTNFAIDQISEVAGEGRDTILASRNVNLAALGNASGLPLEIEVIQVTRTTNTQIIGNDTDHQTLIGNIGDDDLRAGGADATLIGGAGNDTYFADSSTVLLESTGQGVDSVLFDQLGGPGNSFTLAANIENLRANNVTFGAGAVLTGNAADNSIGGLNGNDIIDGAGGADQMSGGSGDDTYFVDNAADQVFENAGGGTDRINASVTFTLGAGQAIEVLQLTGTGNTDATGNELANTVNGNNGANDLFGKGGTDTLFGSGGDDFFHYRSGDGTDVISDFTGAGLQGGDVIQLGGTGLTSFAQVQALMSDLDGGTLITFNATDSLFISGVPTARFDADDFGFV